MPRLEFINSEIKGGSRIFQGDPAEFQTKKYFQVSNSSIIYCWDKYPYANSFVFEKREIRTWTRLKVWSTPKICGTRVPQNAIVLQGRPRPYSIIILNMHFLPKASLRASSQITASSYILERHLWVNNSKPLTLAPTWSLACKQTDCITRGCRNILTSSLYWHPVNRNYFMTLYNVEPMSKTLGRRCINFIQMCCVCWAGGLSLKHCTFLQCWFQRWASVADVGLTVKQRLVSVSLE